MLTLPIASREGSVAVLTVFLMLCLHFLLQAEEAALGEMSEVVQAQQNFIAKHICPLGGHAVATNNFNNVQCLQKMALGFHLHVCALVICVSTSNQRLGPASLDIFHICD